MTAETAPAGVYDLMRVLGVDPATYVPPVRFSTAAPPAGWHPHLVRYRGARWSVDAAPGRNVGIGPGGDWFPHLVNVDPAGARALAVALLQAADVAEQPEPGAS